MGACAFGHTADSEGPDQTATRTVCSGLNISERAASLAGPSC